jgi:hypothetical protein
MYGPPGRVPPVPHDSDEMIHIQTYLRTGDGFSADAFTSLEDFAGERLPGAHYVAGSIEIVVEGEVLLERTDWDDVDWFWSYWVTALGRLAEEARTEVRFPDQDRGIELERAGDELVLELEGRMARVGFEEFAEVALDAAGRFFSLLRDHDEQREVGARGLVEVRRVREKLGLGESVHV